MTVCPPGIVDSVPQMSFNVVVTVLVIVVVCDQQSADPAYCSRGSSKRSCTRVGAAVTVDVDEATRHEQPLETRVAEY